MNSINSLVQQLKAKSNYYNSRQFALCESCFWSATILESRRYDIDVCPLCSSEKMSLIPLAKDEIYELSFRSNGGGLDMRFSKQVDRPDH